MGEVKHTPGPWHVSNGNLIRVTTKNFEGQCICGVHRIGKFSGNAYGDPLANARLIAAAPELFKAVLDCLKELDRSERPSYAWQLRAKAAIDRAEGRSSTPDMEEVSNG